MKKHYEKIFLLVAVIALGLSLGYYFTAKDSIGKDQKKVADTLKKQSGGAGWVTVEVRPLSPKELQWPEVAAQDEDGYWLYQLFTSPKIWIDENGNFVAEPPIAPNSVSGLFGFRQPVFKNIPYPIQYKGYFIDPEGGVVVQLYDESRNMAMRGKTDEDIIIRRPDGKQVKAGLKVTKFERKTVRESDGTIKPVVVVTLFDEALGKEVVIEAGKVTHIEDNRVLTLSPDAPQAKVWEIKKVGDKFEGNNNILYTVKELDFATETALIEKVSPRPNNQNPQIQLFKITREGITKP